MDNVVNTMDTRKRRKEGSCRTPSLESLQASPKRARVHAQRKFAQGSQPNSPAPTPVKETRELRDRSNSNDTRNRIVSQPQSTPPPLLDIVEVPMRPTVEDFLTFLCYRGTPLLPPELEHFNTPQLLETASDSRSQSPARDDKVRSSTKKKQDGLIFDKRERELSKEAVKKNLEHSTDIEDYEATPPVRVTRSSTQPPQVSSTNVVEQHHSPQKVSKRLMIKKALILRSKAKSLRIQERREVSLRKLDKHLGDSSHAQASVIATRSGRLLHKYRVSATTAMARKKAKVAKLSSMRPKQKLSRILQRLGGTSTHSDTRLHRITRSQVEAKDPSTEKRREETQAVGTEKANSQADGSKDVRKEKGNPKVTRSLRLLRQHPDGKKVYVKKVVKVNNKGKSPKELNSSSKSLSLSEPPISEEPVPMARRLRKKSTTPAGSGIESSGTTSSPGSRNSAPGAPSSSVKVSSEPKADSKVLEGSEKVMQKSVQKKLNDVNGNQKKADMPCNNTISENSCVNDIPQSPSYKICSELEECQKSSETVSAVAEKDSEMSIVVDEVLEPKEQCSDIEDKSSLVLQSKMPDEDVSLPADQKDTEILSKEEVSPSQAVNADVTVVNDGLSKSPEGSVESTKDIAESTPVNEEVQKESVEEGSLIDNDSCVETSQEESKPEQASLNEEKSLQEDQEKHTSQAESSCVAQDKPSVTPEESIPASVEMAVIQEKPETESENADHSGSVESCAEKKPGTPEEPCGLRSSASVDENGKDLTSEIVQDEHANKEITENGDTLKLVSVLSSSGNHQSVNNNVIENSSVVQSENILSVDSEENSMVESTTVPLRSSEESGVKTSEASKQATSTKSSQKKSSVTEAACPNTNKKVVGIRETRKVKENMAAQNQTDSNTAEEEISSETGIRTRPSRRTKEAATVYLELIGRKLAKESKAKVSMHGDDYGDDEEDDDDDDAVSVSSIMDLKDLAKTKGRDTEKERRDKLSMWKMDTSEALCENNEAEDQNASTASVRYSTRKSPRQKRDVTDQVADEERAGIGKRRLSKDELSNEVGEDKQAVTKVKRKLEKEENSGPEKVESKSFSKESSPANLSYPGGQKPSVVTRAGSRNLRRTRSDAEEPRRKGSRPSSRRSSLELDSLSSSIKQKQGGKGKQNTLGENIGSEAEEGIIVLDEVDQSASADNSAADTGDAPQPVTQLEEKCDNASDSIVSDGKEVIDECGKDDKETCSDKNVNKSEVDVVMKADFEIKEQPAVKKTDVESKEKLVLKKADVEIKETPLSKKTDVENKEKPSLKKPDVETKEKPLLKKTDPESKEKPLSKKTDESKEKPLSKKTDVESKEKPVLKKTDVEAKEKANISDSENDIIFLSESKDRVVRSSPASASPEIVHEVINKAPVITGKTHRTVLQDRKSRKNVAKDEGKYMSRRKSSENSTENVLGHANIKSHLRGKIGTCGSGDDSSNDTEEKKSLRAFGRQKVVGSRRRSSNHDEAKLNEVLESVAKDFERDIDEDHYDQIEKDFVLGNKSPDKGISDKMIELSEKEDSNLTEFINFCMDDKISCNLEAFGSSGNERTQSGNTTPQPGSSSPSLNKRSASSKKLSDVVRSLQKKQAESPSSTSGPTENPTFLKDLNTWSSDKLRQVSPHSGSFHLESPSTSSAPKVTSPNDASMPEIVHNPCAPTITPPSPETITSKVPSPLPDRSFPQKVAITKTPCVGPPTNSPVTSHSSSSVVTMTTSCLQANAPYTAVTFSASYNVVHTSTAPLGTPAPACDIQTVNSVPKSVPLKSYQTSKDEEVTVLSSIPVAVNPPTSVNVLNSGFSPTVVPGLPKITPSVTLSSHGSCVLTCAKSFDLPAQKSSPKQLHIAPKPSRSATLTSSTLTNPLPLPVLPQGAIKQVPKPVQIAPKPPASATQVHHNTQMLTHQPTHLMQTQVQTPMQALPQQIQGVKAIPQTVQTLPTALSQPVQNMQALSQTVQTMQAIPQPVQSMHPIPQTVQTVPQPIQTVQTLAPPMQTVTAVPVQAVITQTVINPTHIVTPSSPARMMNHPVFATSSNQSTVTYTLAPHPISQSQLQTNVGAVARVLTPTVVEKVAARPQSNMMTPKPPESVVTLSPGTIAGAGSVRPIAPLPQQVQVTQPQILAVNVVPVVSTAMVGQGGLITRPQGSAVVPSCHVSGSQHFVPPTSTVNSETCASNPHTTLAFSQHVPLSNPSTSYVPSNTVVAAYPLPSSGVAVNPAQNNMGNPQNVVCETVPISANHPSRALMVSNPPNIKPVCNSKTVQNPHPVSSNIPTSTTGISISKSNAVMSNSSENGQSAVTDRRLNSSTTTAIVEAAFRGNIPSSVKIAETSKSVHKVNGPVSVTNSKCHSRVPELMKSQIASSSITITSIGEVSQGRGDIANLKPITPIVQVSASSDLNIKLPTGVSVVHHKPGVGRNVARTSLPSMVGTSSSLSQTCENDRGVGGTVSLSAEKGRRVIPPQLKKDDVYNTFIATSCSKFDREKVSNPASKNDTNLYQPNESQYKSNRDVAAYTSCTDKSKMSHPPLGPSQEIRHMDKVPNSSDKPQNEFDKRTADKRREPLLKRTLFKTKSHEERRPTNMSPVYRTKSQDDKKPSGAFSPLHESSVYAFDEPDIETSPIEVSPFSQRIKNIQSSPGTSPVKPCNAVKPPNPIPAGTKPLGRINVGSRCHVSRSLAPLISGKPKPGIVSNATAAQPVLSAKKAPCSPKGVSTATDTAACTAKLDAASEAGNELNKTAEESQQVSENNECIKKNSNSTSIAIQCDMDETIAEESVRANESGTQTEGPSKFPLPPSASPFYYLPLAMAALGEKLPAQLVQQMLAKTQGIVGAAEAGLILQKAAQLAQQHQQNLAQQGTPGPCLGVSSAVKPIKPASVAPLISGISSNPSGTNAAPVKPPVSKYQETPSTSGETVTTTTTATVSNAESKVAASSSSVNVSTSDSVSVTSSVTSVTSPSQVSSSPFITTVTPTCVSSTPTPNVPGTNADLPSHIPPHRPQPTTTTIPPNEEVGPTSVNKVEPEPKSRKRKGQSNDANKNQCDDNPPTRRRSGRATTLAATRATESDMHEIEELRRNRRAKRAAAALAKEEGWSSSSEAPLSPQMSPDTLRGWPPPRLTSPTPSQSSEGTTSSTPSQRGNRLSASHSRRQSPASNIDNKSYSSIGGISASHLASNSTSVTPDKTAEESITYVCDNSVLVRAPSFYPSEEEFSDPLDYIEKIRPEAEQFGVCRIVPPSSFKPECRVNDDMRFTSNNQYIHKMMKRWGPNVRTLHAIKRCLSRQNIELTSNPLIGCMELDLVRLYEVVEQHGGLMSVIEKDMWGKVADACRIPRSAQERLTKLDSIYCKYLLPYATLSQEERAQLLEEVDAMHSRNRGEQPPLGKRTSSVTSDAEDEEEEESLDCIVKGKSTALSTFYRVARNISTQWQPDPSGLEVDERYWSIVVNGTHHVCVLSASIDTSEHAYGFPNHRNSPLAKHPWNLKNLCQNPNSVLRSMGTIVGVTAPTLHVGMLFSTVCWYRDPHGLPWIEYLHTGASKIWYGVAANQEEKLCAALKKIVPDFVKDSAIWLPSDTAMVPPTELVREGVRVCRVVQDPGQFVVVFPGAFTSSICKGYLISESAFFARPQYFDRAVASFKALHDCCEPSMFSLDRLVLSVVSDPRATLDGLLRARELVLQVVEKEKRLRSQLVDIGLETSERLSTPDSHRKKKNRFIEDEEENMCEVCRQNLYVALVTNSQEEAVYCLEHALLFLSKNPSHLEFCKLMYTYSLSELDSAIKQMDERIHAKSGSKKSPYSKKAKSREHLDSFSSTSSSNL